MSAQSSVLQFVGATGTVTGSCFALRTPESTVLVDCGLFQGTRELRRRNWNPFPLDPATIDAVVLTHAHLDHCGYLPRLSKHGFRGPVYATEATVDLARIVLLDSAHLQEEDAAHARGHRYSRHAEPQPLYTTADVNRMLPQFRALPFDSEHPVAKGVRTVLRPAGHILGAATALLEVGDSGATALFSGDLGRASHPLLAAPAPPSAAEVMVIESTYGNRSHPPADSGLLASVISRTIGRGGTVLIPAFAVDRTEIILMELRRLDRLGSIPHVPIYVDSPMALDTLAVYRDAIRNASPEIRQAPGGEDPFDTGDLHEMRTVEESKTLNGPRWPCIIISASGMASGGRVLHHLEGLLPDPRNTVLMVGYQAVSTRGRDLVDGAKAVKIHGRYVPVRADVVDLPTFSVHADADEMLAWLARAPRPPQTCYLVHGEPAASAALRDRIERELGWTAVVPRQDERVLIDEAR